MTDTEPLNYSRIRQAGVAFTAVLLLFAAVTHDARDGDGWLFLTLFIYALPLLSQFLPSTSIRVYGVFLGVFLLSQALARPEYFRGDYLTLPPHMEKVVEVPGINGIVGPQRITTDAKGFRITKEIDYQSDSGYRIFAVGGSTTKQTYLDDRKTWTHLLQEDLSAVTDTEIEVVNTGLHGLRAIHHLATMKETLELNPDMYIFLMGANDWMHQINVEFLSVTEMLKKYTFKKTLLGSAMNRLFSRYSVPFMGKHRSAGRKNGASDNNSELPFDPYQFKRGSIFQRDQREFRPEGVHDHYDETLARIGALCREHGLTCVFATQPIGYKPGISLAFKRLFWMTSPNGGNYTVNLGSLIHIAEMYNDRLREFAADNGFLLCDLDERVEPSLENFYDEMHFNEGGARNVARYLSDCLADAVKAN